MSNQRVVLITGASKGLGYAVASKMLAEGAKVINLSRTHSPLNDPNLVNISCDITRLEEVQKAAAEIAEEYSAVDVLINNAGTWHKTGQLETISAEQVDAALDLNLKGLIYVTKEILPLIRKSDSGYIINVSSQSGVRAMEGQTVYCASKFGVKGFTDSLKLDLKGAGIKVVGFYPSGMNTQMFEKAGEEFSSENFMKVEDIAQIISFILSQPKNICLEEVWVKKFE